MESLITSRKKKHSCGDDTFLHSAINRSEQARVVLLFDVFRQDQPFWLIGMSWVFLWVAQIWQYLQNMRERALLR